jgi:uncharacterized protein YktB (UPF0637 family)
MERIVFNAGDFDIFRIPDFSERMSQIRGRVRPKLEALGSALAPPLSLIMGSPGFAHVAKHARRTVNPPGDTWVAFCTDKRGYKKHPHFKIAISQNCIRLLFEIGPEFAHKKHWAERWKKRAGSFIPKGEFVWFRNEHDEEPAGKLSSLSKDRIGELAEGLTRRKDGQIVLGKIVPKEAALRWTPQRYHREALKTFEAFQPLYTLQ